MGCITSTQDCACIKNCFDTIQDLPSEDLEVLKSKTIYDENTIKEMHKRFTKNCPNGRLTPQKFIEMCNTLSLKGNAEDYCDHVFRTFDADKNGFIDFKEFLLALYITCDGTAEEKLEAAFRMHDVDGNGFIDLDEMTKVLRAIYGMVGEGSSDAAFRAEEMTRNIFDRMDENKDGYLTEEEFVQGCLQNNELSKMFLPNAMQ